MAAIPSIACLAVIGKNVSPPAPRASTRSTNVLLQNNPLHIALFPTPACQHAPLLTPLQASLCLASTLDIFEARATAHLTTGTGLSGDYGLLHAMDERLAAYGYETNTAVRFVALVDMMGRPVAPLEAGRADLEAGSFGLREGELKAVFKAMQNAYVRLLQNPFFDPDEYLGGPGSVGKRITSPRFVEEVRRIGERWVPGGMMG